MTKQEPRFGWLEKALILGAVAILAGVTYPLWLGDGKTTNGTSSVGTPKSDFPEGTTPLYTAEFKDWPTPITDYGSIALGNGNSYILKATGNRWTGGELPTAMTPLEKDFVAELQFKILQGDPTIQMQLSGTQDNTDVVRLYLSFEKGALSYHLEKGRMKRAQQTVARPVTEEIIAERAFVNPSIARSNWAAGGKVTLKRDGNRMQFFINDHFMQDFAAPKLAFDQMYVGVVQSATVEITKLETRVRP